MPTNTRSAAGAESCDRAAGRPGLSVTTGYVDDPLPQLAELRAQGVRTDAEYESAKANALRQI